MILTLVLKDRRGYEKRTYHLTTPSDLTNWLPSPFERLCHNRRQSALLFSCHFERSEKSRSLAFARDDKLHIPDITTQFPTGEKIFSTQKFFFGQTCDMTSAIISCPSPAEFFPA